MQRNVAIVQGHPDPAKGQRWLAKMREFGEAADSGYL